MIAYIVINRITGEIIFHGTLKEAVYKWENAGITRNLEVREVDVKEIRTLNPSELAMASEAFKGRKQR